MANVRVVMQRSGILALLKSDEVANDLDARGQRIAAAAGGAPDFVVESTIGGTRARTAIITGTVEGMLAEARDRTLTRALDAGRG